MPSARQFIEFLPALLLAAVLPLTPLAGCDSAGKKEKAAEQVSPSGEVESGRVQELEAGIEAALGQAREIIALLDTGSKKR